MEYSLLKYSVINVREDKDKVIVRIMKCIYENKILTSFVKMYQKNIIHQFINWI